MNNINISSDPLESVMFSNRENSQVMPNHNSSSQDLRHANCSYSSEENCCLMSYHKDEESGQVFTTPIGSLNEGTTSRYINNNIWHLHSLSIDESHGYG